VAGRRGLALVLLPTRGLAMGLSAAIVVIVRNGRWLDPDESYCCRVRRNRSSRMIVVYTFLVGFQWLKCERAGTMSRLEPPDFTAMLEQTRAARTRAELDLKQLCTEVNAEHLFAAVFAHLVLAPAGGANEITHAAVPIKIEVLAYHLIPFFGSVHDKTIDAFHISRALEALDILFTARQRESMFSKLQQNRCSDPDVRALDDLVWSVRLDAETVRGFAYPEQIAREIRETLGHFDDWFDKRIGISPGRGLSAACDRFGA
jgi:hypothetical protein